MFNKRILGALLVILLMVSVFSIGCTQKQQDKEAVEATGADDISKLEPIKITYAHMDVAQPNMLNHGTALFFKERVEKYSNGKITVEVVGGGALGSAAELLEQVSTGQIEMAGSITEGNLAGNWKDINALGVPYAVRSAEHAMDIIDSGFGDEVKAKILETTGGRVAYVFPNGGLRNFTNNVRPIKTPEDLKGLKIRTMDNQAHMAIVKALGASPTPIAWTETYTALQTGVVDGQENSIPSTLQGRVQEVQKYMSTDGHVASFMFILMNDKWYQNQPEAYKKILDQACVDAESFARRFCGVINVVGRDTMVKAGVEFHDTTPEELAKFREATKDVKQLIKTTLVNDPAWVDKFEKAVAESEKRLGY